MNTKTIVIAGLVALALLLGYLYFNRANVTAGASNATGMAHYQLESFLQGLQIGPRGTPLTLYASGTCTLKADFSMTASTTRNVSCTGITLQNNTTYTGVSTDIVDVQLAASTTAASAYVVKSAQASTTATGSIELQLINLTGTTATPAGTTGFGSSTQYQIYR